MKRLASDIWDGLRGQAARTALSMLAVCVGMTALTILLAVLGGLRMKSKAIIDEMGANVFVLQASGQSRPDGSTLSLNTLALLRASLGGSIVSGLRSFETGTPGDAQTIRIFAADHDYFRIHRWKLESGRILDPQDQASSSRSVLITAPLARSRSWQMGQVILLKNTPFTIVGITERPGIALESESSETSFAPNNATVFIPLSSSTPWLDEKALRSGHLDSIEVQSPDSSQLESTVSCARRLLANRSGTDSFTWITPDSVLESVRHLEKMIGFTAGSVAFLCLILGGTTLMSLMVANVRDRIPEIALRRTLGATSRDIASLFIAEACFVTILASLGGVAIAALVLALTRDNFPVPVSLAWPTLTIPLFVAVILGVCFSYLPVRMAMGITPAEALRND